MVKNKITVSCSVPVRSYQMYAYPLAVIFNKKEEADNWCFSNFINFRLTRNEYIVDVRYTEPRYEKCHFFKERMISQSLFTDNLLGDVKEFIINCIDSQDTVSVFVDEFYINHRIRYQKEHKAHQIMVTGYDKENKIFHVLGYNEYRKYSETTTLMDDFVCGVKKCPMISDLSEYIKVFEIIESDKKCELSLTDFKQELTNFYKSSTLTSSDKYECIFGLKVYDAIIETINDYMFEYHNYPMFYMLNESKYNMYWKLQILENYGWDFKYEKGLYQELQNLTRENLKIFSKRMFIPKDSTKFKEVSDRLIYNLKKISEIEKKCVYCVLNKMQYQ